MKFPTGLFVFVCAVVLVLSIHAIWVGTHTRLLDDREMCVQTKAIEAIIPRDIYCSRITYDMRYSNYTVILHNKVTDETYQFVNRDFDNILISIYEKFNGGGKFRGRW